MSTSVELRAFKGLNNMATQETRGFDFFDEALNVIVDDNGKVRTRKGCLKVNSDNSHSLYARDNVLYYRTGTVLNKMSLDTMTPVSIRNDMSGSSRVWYKAIAGKIYYTDRVASGVIDPNFNHGWGIVPPTTMTVSTGLGSLTEGTIYVTYTYVRSDSLESGICRPILSADLSDGEGFSVGYAASTDVNVDSIRIYATKPDGETMFMVTEIDNGTGTYNYQGDGSGFNLPCETEMFYPAPVGRIVDYYRGIVYIASQNVIWHSEPLQYEHFNLTANFIQFEDAVTVMAAVLDGIYVATTKNIYFLQGEGPPFKAIKLADYGAVYGTQAMSHEGDTVFFVSYHGVCSGTIQGQFKNLTIGTFGLPASTTGGSGAIVHNDGTEQYIFALYGADIQPANQYQYLSYMDIQKSFSNQQWADMGIKIPLPTITMQ